MSNQPVWRLIANLGDANPFDHGGEFLYVDATGVYDPVLERVEWIETEATQGDEEIGVWDVYRTPLERCTYTDGVLSDNRYFPESETWFAWSIHHVQSWGGLDDADLIANLCSDEPLHRAWAYSVLASFHGWHEFDNYPLRFESRQEVEDHCYQWFMLEADIPTDMPPLIAADLAAERGLVKLESRLRRVAAARKESA